MLISNDNGANWTRSTPRAGATTRWEEQAIRVADYVTPTFQMKVRFVAADLGSGSIVEAAIDDIVTYPSSRSSRSRARRR